MHFDHTLVSLFCISLNMKQDYQFNSVDHLSFLRPSTLPTSTVWSCQQLPLSDSLYCHSNFDGTGCNKQQLAYCLAAVCLKTNVQWFNLLVLFLPAHCCFEDVSYDQTFVHVLEFRYYSWQNPFQSGVKRNKTNSI